MKNSFSGKISVKDFISEIKGCKTIDLKDFKKEIISEEIDEETKSSTTITKVEGHFSGIMKKTIKPTDKKDTILDLILKELKEIRTDVSELKQDVTELKQDVADIKVRVTNLEKDVTELKQDVTELKQDIADIKIRVSNIEKCPTVQKELVTL